MIPPLLEHVTTKITNTLMEKADGIPPGFSPVFDMPSKPTQPWGDSDHGTSTSALDWLGLALQYAMPATWMPPLMGFDGYKPYVLPPEPSDKLIDHGHWVQHNGVWYYWNVTRDDNPPSFWRRPHMNEHELPFGPPSNPDDTTNAFSLEHPKGSGMWFEWVPDPDHPHGGHWLPPNYVDPNTGTPGYHLENPNHPHYYKR